MVWLLECDFANTEAPPTRRLLRPSKSYAFGRKPPADIIIASKQVSQDAGRISVAAFSAECVADAAARPAVTLHAGRKGMRVILPADEPAYRANLAGFVGAVVEPDTERRVDDQSLVVVAKSVPTPRLVWQNFTFCVHRETAKEMEPRVAAAAVMGAHIVVSKTFAAADYYVTNKASLTTRLMLALTNGVPIVSMAYLDEVLRLGALADGAESSLETSFDMPDPDMYKPEPLNIEQAAEGEFDTHAFLDMLSVDVRRRTLLVGTTALFIRTGTEEASAQMMLAELAGAKNESIESSSSYLESDSNLRRILQQHKTKAAARLAALPDAAEVSKRAPEGGLVILVEAAIRCGEEEWYRRLARIASELGISMPDPGATNISQAILHVDVRTFLGSAPSSESAPSLRDQPTQDYTTQPPAESLRSGGSQTTQEPVTQAPESMAPPTPPLPAPSAGAADAPMSAPAAPVKRQLKRRADTGSVANPLDALFAMDDDPSSRPAPVQSLLSSEQSAPRSAPRLKRRAGARPSDAWNAAFGGGPSAEDMLAESSGSGAANAGFSASASLGASLDSTGQLKSKRFRAQLDQEDARARAEASGVPYVEPAPPPTATQGADAGRADVAMDDAPAPFEKEKRSKRPAPASPSDESPQRPRAKRVEGEAERARVGTGADEEPERNGVRRERPGQAGIAPGEKAQRDEGFLMALKSRSKGRAKLDRFDEEFNRLRIARPPNAGGCLADPLIVNPADVDDLAYEAFKAAPPEQLEELFRISAAGNFVEVDFVPLVRQRPAAAVVVRDASVPNFKKFKSTNRTKRTPIALSLPDENDYVSGTRRAGPSVPSASVRPSQIDELDQDDGDVLAGLHAPAAPARGKKKKSIFASVSDSESDGAGEGDEAPLGGRRVGRRATGRDSGGRSRAVVRDEEESEPEADEQRSPEPDLRLDVDYAPMDLSADMGPPRTATRQRKGTAVPSSSRQRTRESPAAAPGRSDSQVDQLITDDDDDDGEVFSGFKRKKAPSASAGGSKRTRR